MYMDFAAALVAKLTDVMTGLLPSTLAMAAICTVLYWFSSQACNPATPWWRNRGLLTDAWYWLITPFLAPYIRMTLLIAFATFTLPFITQAELSNYINNGYGPLGSLPFWWQAAVYLLLSDFMLYWIHRIFHGAKLWRFHVIHHSAEDVDWTTAYRFHPVNLFLGPFFADVAMLYIGVSPTVLLSLAPFQTMTSLFVHANLNWTFGPLKYVIATPVFHRWHHSSPDLGGEQNFAPTFALWDVMFGTFYMPQAALPQHYGTDDPNVPEGFFQQLIYPFTAKANRKPDGWTGAITGSPSAIGSVEPQRGS
jgi:sterol desaturase/sphingolipid hydroxylase (fatty acid hydroxylase superfamily)